MTYEDAIVDIVLKPMKKQKPKARKLWNRFRRSMKKHE